MNIDANKTPVLYSINTQLAYSISKRYYNNIHFVWCTAEFNNLKQPPTSNPQTICNRFLEQVTKGDIHAKEIEANIAGILRGANCKLNEKVISEKQFERIRHIVDVAEYKLFFPLIYIIHTDKVLHKIIEVRKEDCASETSVEYKIERLEEGEFDVIKLEDVLHNIVVPKEGEVNYESI